MMRMLAWVNLLANDGLVNRIITLGGIFRRHVDWLSGRSIVVILGLVYGYVPYMIIPLYAGLDRLPQSMLEARPRPRRQPVLGVLAGHAGRCADRSWWPACCSPACRCSATTSPATCSPARRSTSMVGNLINETVLTPGPDRPGRRLRAARADRLAGADALLRPLGLARRRSVGMSP